MQGKKCRLTIMNYLFTYCIMQNAVKGLKSHYVVKILCTLFALSLPKLSNAVDVNQATVNLTGNISPVCSITLSGAGTVALGNAAVGVAQSIPFSLTCNQPVQYSLSALNGRLKHDQYTTLPAYDSAQATAFLPYAVQILVNNNPYAQTVAGLTVAADALLSNAVVTGNTAGITPHATTGTIAVQRTAVTGNLMPIAGNYSDTLTVDVTPVS